MPPGPKINKLVLLLGSNLGDSAALLHRAGSLIENRIGCILKQSSVYISDAWGKTDQPPFLNQALLVESFLEKGAVLKHIMDIEEQLGRIRTQKWGARLIDIDILLSGNVILNTPELSLPHPYLHLRRFSLTPLYDVWPDWVHPVLKKNVAALLEACPDKGRVAARVEA